ncbi:hypothetical protein ABB07_00365 [Streptomyces incarnatus]|uniref:Secreted protein n=1 Tax=Streptomyces incarnatus TaxID=665007 RepID=A0ABM5TC55_9ACTN|nr:hypothetical protein ABB07_00365 [Streptomyces incarnatus]
MLMISSTAILMCGGAMASSASSWEQRCRMTSCGRSLPASESSASSGMSSSLRTTSPGSPSSGWPGSVSPRERRMRRRTWRNLVILL